MPSQRERKWSNKVGRSVYNAANNRPSGHRKMQQGFSSTVWNLAAVHRLLQARRTAPAIRPGLHELAARQSAFMGKCTRCRWTIPEARLERVQLAWTVSRTLSLCSNRVEQSRRRRHRHIAAETKAGIYGSGGMAEDNSHRKIGSRAMVNR